MAIAIKLYNKETGKKIEIGVGETTTVQACMQQLRTKGLIDENKAYYLTTVSGDFCDSGSTFFQLKGKEFYIIQGVYKLPTFLQLGIFVLDGSGSMKTGVVGGNKMPCQAVDEAMKSTIEFFKKSSKKECFSFSVVAFGDNARVVLKPQKVEEIDSSQSFIATEIFNGGKGSTRTNIASGLAIAEEQARQFFANKKGNLIHKVVVIVLSDGMCHYEENTRLIAGQLKQIPNLNICSCHLETGTNEPSAVALLKEISNHYETVYNEATIRKFFVESSERANPKYNAG